jgi:endonuclease YncB( thermonuclease family)
MRMSFPVRLRAVAFFLALLPILAATGDETGGSENPLTGLTRFDGVQWIDDESNDGDSFHARLPDGETVTLRLYEADALELHVFDESQARRLRSQRRYFGISDYGGSFDSSIALAKDFARRAAAFTREALREPFTVYTAFADGRGQTDRIYAFVVTADGKSLAAELVRAGLARSVGVYRRTPGNLSRDEAEERLDDLELLAAGSRRGIWAHTDWESLPDERLVDRRGDPELVASLDPRKVVEKASVAVNSADASELERVPGIGPVTAARIVRQRTDAPFRDPGDLTRIRGIGAKTAARIAPFLRFDLPGGNAPPSR